MLPPHVRNRRPAPAPEPRERLSLFGAIGRMIGWGILLLAIVLVGVVAGPGLPDRLNPLVPLDPLAEPGILTPYKLERATRTAEACFAAMEKLPDAGYAQLPDRVVDADCHVRQHTVLRRLGPTSLGNVSTRCGTALRLAMWERHTLRPAARARFDAEVTDIAHFGSYSCRMMNTTSGASEEFSAHATANAIDVAGVVLDDGRLLTIEDGWRSGDEAVRAFWRELRDGACTWFGTVLSPEFNSLHADHFHLAQGRYGACR